MFRCKNILIITLFILIGIQVTAQDHRLKDIAFIEGVRDNQLIGFGIVTGLDGRGDSPQSELTRQVLSNLYRSLGITVDSDEIESKNAAVVMVTADLPPFVRPGDRISVRISSAGDARSLSGGVLLQTPLQGANGNTYAVAQGRLMVPNTDDANTTVANIPEGAIVENEVISVFVQEDRMTLVLREPDFTTANNAANAINAAFSTGTAVPVDASRIDITLPEEQRSNPVGFIAAIEQIPIETDIPARVVINQESGVVVFGNNIRISPVGVSYQGTEISVGSRSSMYASRNNQNRNTFYFEEHTTVQDLITTLQEIGIETENIIEMLQAIEEAGALHGELIIM
ncbi:MAG: flagellar basal body P-ring protein FlgI [Spirochaetia bacterium]